MLVLGTVRRSGARYGVRVRERATTVTKKGSGSEWREIRSADNRRKWKDRWMKRWTLDGRKNSQSQRMIDGECDGKPCRRKQNRT